MKAKFVIAIILMLSVVSLGDVTGTDGYDWLKYDCDADTTGFTYNFRILQASDLIVIHYDSSTDTPTLLTNVTDYKVSVTNEDYRNATGGTVTTVATYGTTIDLIISTQFTMTQLAQMTYRWRPATVEDALDKSRLIDRQFQRNLLRCVRGPEDDDPNLVMQLGNAAERASKWLGFGATGEVVLSDSVTPDNVIVSDWGETIIDDPNAAGGRRTLELNTDDDVEFATIISTTGTFDNVIGATGTFDNIITKGPWADIRAYGADTSNADNSTAIQAAFDSGKSVLIPEGDFIVLSALTWTTDDATLMFVSRKSKIWAGATFPVDTPIIHFSGVHGCSIYNLNLVASQRATGVLLTDSEIISFYSPKLSSCKSGDDNYAFDIIASTTHISNICVYSMHIYGSGDSGGIRLDGDSYDILNCGFRDIKIQQVRHGIYLKSRCLSNDFSNLMIDCGSTDAGTFAIKEEVGVGNIKNIFNTVKVENTSANGTGIDMQATDSWSTMWNHWVVNFSTKTVFDELISVKSDYRIDGVQLRSRNRTLVLHGKFNGYSPDASMTWGAARSASVASGDWDKWDFILPLPDRSVIRTITNEFYTDDGSADLRMQVWKQAAWLSTWTQVGSDHDFTGDGSHAATIDYTIEIGYVVKVSILAKRGAGSFLYVYPLAVVADY